MSKGLNPVMFLVNFFLFFLLLLSCVSIFRYYYNSHQENSFVNSIYNSYVSAKNENNSLNNQLNYVQTDSYIKSEAVNNLGLVKSGFYEVVLPTNTVDNTQNTSLKTQSSNSQYRGQYVYNLQLWLSLIGL